MDNSGKIVIIGLGNIGLALAKGIRSRHPQQEIVVCTRGAAGGDVADGETNGGWGLAPPVCSVSEGSSPLALGPQDTIVLCVKPQNFVQAVHMWRSVVIDQSDRPLVISVLAGTPTSLIQKYFAPHSPVVRAMPNIGATIDQAATALCRSQGTPRDAIKRAADIFGCVGKTWVVDEEKMNAVTGVSGSGPAYIYMVIEALSDGGVKMGLSRKLALELATQTVIGAAKLVESTGEHPAVLRDQVTTPGGTTIAAIHELEKHGLRPMLISAVVTATQRGEAIAARVEEQLTKALNGQEGPST